MTRATLLLVGLACACGHAKEAEIVAPEPAPVPSVLVQAVALDVEIYEPHDGTPVARPSLVAAVGSPAEVSAEFTLRPARRHVRRLDLELTPTRVSGQTCELAIRSQVADDPRQRIAGGPRSETMRVGEWVEVVTLDLVKARVRCVPPSQLVAGR